MSKKHRVFSREFKEQVARRILHGESVTAIRLELEIQRSVLYRWRDAFRPKEGGAGSPAGAAPRSAKSVSSATAAQRVAELERKVGQQAVDIDFLRRAFKRVKASRQNSIGVGATASTGRSER